MSESEIRQAGGEIRAVSKSDHTFELRICTFNVVDSYGSVWEPGVFQESLRTKLPPACWGHDWARVIGSVVEHDERPDGQYGLVKMADMDAVPDSRMAYSLIGDGHVSQTSFGFKREEWVDGTRADYTPSMDGEKERMVRARLDEISPVLVGAVPGARVLAVRSQEKMSRMDAGQLLVAVATGQVTLRDALNALESGENLRAPEAEEQLELDISEEDAELAFALMALDEDHDADRAFGAVTNPKGTAQLKEYWAHGKGALKVKWGTPGDHTRCVRLVSKYLPPNQVHGFCTNVEQLARGKVGGKEAGH